MNWPFCSALVSPLQKNSILDNYGYRQAIVVFRPSEDIRTVYGGVETVKSLSDWVYEKAVPLVGEYNQDSAPLYTKRYCY
jgi:hypothetical protein